MFVDQWKRTATAGWEAVRSSAGPPAELVLFFTDTETLAEPRTWRELRERWPDARLIGCSTAGEICDVQVLDASVVATAIAFQRTPFEIAAVYHDEGGDSRTIGARLAERLPRNGLTHVFVLSEGLQVNGSALVDGLSAGLGPDIGLTGGLSGDGPRFEKTAVCLDDPERIAAAVAVGFYGDAIRIGMGTLGGWDPFGIERRVTRSKGNVLYELDGRPALALYQQYLGDQASGLPATGLLYPLKVRMGPEGRGIVRTILAVNHDEGSLTFAGDVPMGSHAQLMKANFDRLVDGAAGAAVAGMETADGQPDLAILVSCVGRKLVLEQRIEEEVEAVREVYDTAVLAGFYSYGEISPFTPGARCELHNQTMTITTFRER